MKWFPNPVFNVKRKGEILSQVSPALPKVLVPQNPPYEPESALIERIKADVKQKKPTRKQKTKVVS
jgi:hypothetical protein